MRRVAIAGRPIQHGFHPQPVRDIPGPLLGHHRSDHLSDEDDPDQVGAADSRGVDLLQRHLFSGDRVVEGGQGAAGAGLQVSVHRAPGVPHFLFYHLVLSAAVRYGVHVLQDLQGGGDPDALPEAGDQAGPPGIGRAGTDFEDPQVR